MVPDAEALVVAYLRADSDVQAIVGERVATRNQDSFSEPWVKVTQLADPVVGKSSADHFIEAHLQVDCYGGKDLATAEDEASLLRRTVRASLHAMPDADHDDAVVTCVKFGGTGSARIPDTSEEPARPRYVTDVFVYAHAAPGA